MRSDEEISGNFEPLYADLVDQEDYPKKRPLLAHYTSLASIEKILDSEEVWFSNPLVMNDLDEVRFGLFKGSEIFFKSDQIKQACKSSSRVEILRAAFDHYLGIFSDQHAFDTYVFCLSEHDRNDDDGLLSMWRGYGSNGHGAALVFDTQKLVASEKSPLIIARVHYASADERIEWIQGLMTRFSQCLTNAEVPDDKLYIAANALFERLKLFALFSKHCGFREEREWRVVYSPDRDDGGLLKPMLHYSIGPRGAEPRLRFKFEPFDGVSGSNVSLENLIDRIILGPTISTPMARMAILRMLDRLNKESLKDKVCASSIPFRPV